MQAIPYFMGWPKKTLNLEVESHFCPNVAAKGKSLMKFVPQLTKEGTNGSSILSLALKNIDGELVIRHS
jgi:hypothetical protein